MFRKVKQDRIYKDIANQILESIFRGDLAPEDKLPSEKELQEIFGVSRVTIREAIQCLDQFGVIEVRQGSQGGAYIKKMDLNDILPQIENALKMTNLTLIQVTEARAALEEAVLRRMIPSRLSATDSAKLEHTIAEADSGLKDRDGKKGMMDYFDFHTLLAEMTGNPIIILMNRLIHSLLLQFFKDADASVSMTKETLKDHKRIAKALLNGKFEEASRISASHITSVSRQIVEKSEEKSLLGKRK